MRTYTIAVDFKKEYEITAKNKKEALKILEHRIDGASAVFTTRLTTPIVLSVIGGKK